MSSVIPRRQLLTGMASLGLPAFGAARAREVVRLRLGHAQPERHPVHAGCRTAADLLARVSDGEVTLEIVPASREGTGETMLRKVAAGELDGCLYIAGTLVDALGADPALTLFDMPMLARDWPHMRAIAASDWAWQRFGALAAARGIRRLGPAWCYGTRHLTTARVPVREAGQLRGLRIRTPNALPLYAEFFAALGAEPVPIAFPVLMERLRSGEIEGQENPIPTIHATRLYEVQRFLSLTAHTVNPYFALVSRAAWERLSPVRRDQLAEALEAGARTNDVAFLEEEQALRSVLAAAGMTVLEVDRSGFVSAAMKLHRRWGESFGADVIPRLREL
jgi:TRAP-type transport system periplasmic protein